MYIDDLERLMLLAVKHDHVQSVECIGDDTVKMTFYPRSPVAKEVKKDDVDKPRTRPNGLDAAILASG